MIALREIAKAVMLFVIAFYNFFLAEDFMPLSLVDNILISGISILVYSLLVKRDINGLEKEEKRRLIPYGLFLLETDICVMVICYKYKYHTPDITSQDLACIELLIKLVILLYCVVSFLFVLRLKSARRHKIKHGNDCVTG